MSVKPKTCQVTNCHRPAKKVGNFCSLHAECWHFGINNIAGRRIQWPNQQNEGKTAP